MKDGEIIEKVGKIYVADSGALREAIRLAKKSVFDDIKEKLLDQPDYMTIHKLQWKELKKKHLGSDLCPQTVQRSTEGLPDGCAEKPKYVIESTEGEMTSEELDKRAKKITGVEK